LGTINIAYTSNIIPYQNQRETGWLYYTNFEKGKTDSVKIIVPNAALLNAYTTNANWANFIRDNIFATI
jgi:hypothetical protein